MYTKNEIGVLLHKSETIDDFLIIQTEILENVDYYLEQFSVDYFYFIGVYAIEAITRLLEKLGNQMQKLACFHFFTTLFHDFERFYNIGGALYFKNSVLSMEDKFRNTASF